MPAMAKLMRAQAAGALLLALLAPACGSGEPEADPAALNATLNAIVARDEAERANMIAESRAREAARMREMEQNAQNYAAMPD